MNTNSNNNDPPNDVDNEENDCPQWKKNKNTNPHKHPFTMAYPSLYLYGMAHSINWITTITTVQFLFGMEPHIPILCMTTMMMMIPTTTRMIMTNMVQSMTTPVDSFMNNPSVKSQFQKFIQAIQDHDDAMEEYTQAMTQDPPQVTPQAVP